MLKYILFALVGMGALLVLHFWDVSKGPTHDQVNMPRHYAQYGREDFYPHLFTDPAPSPIEEKIYGGILSHHFYVEAELSAFFRRLRSQRPRVVVVIGPNHFDAGRDNILVSRYAYETPWGLLYPAQSVVASLIDRGTARQEEQPFEREHSISSLVGFVRHTFPDTKFVPIIIKRDTPEAEVDQLVEDLDAVLPRDSMVLASVDFSHHQNRFAAGFHDAKSIPSIQSFDYESIAKLEIDSPQSIRAVLKFLEKRGAGNMEYTTTNAALVARNPAHEDVTSYLFAYFSKGRAIGQPAVSVLSFGDAMLGRDVGTLVEQGGDPFDQLKGVEGNFFKGMDFITLNLEGVITERRDCKSDGMVFRFPIKTAELLRHSNIRMVNLANNHSADCGPLGILDTFDHLQTAGIGHFGGPPRDSREEIRNIGGKTVALYGVNLIAAFPGEIEPLLAEIRLLDHNNDYVVVNAHWGVEYDTLPSHDQRQLARELVDAGADVVIGHHPHVVQPLEIYRNKPIFYSLGNLVFDQTRRGTDEGIGIGSVFQGDTIRLFLFPYRINHFQPKLLPADEAIDFCTTYLEDISDRDGCAFTLKP